MSLTITQTPSLSSGIKTWALGSVEIVKKAMERRATYRRTINELSVLSARELRDLGISRSEIKYLAKENS